MTSKPKHSTNASHLQIVAARLAISAIGFLFSAFSPALCQQQQPSKGHPPTPRASFTSADRPLQEFSFEQLHMALPVRITVWAESKTIAQTVCKKAFKKVGLLVKIFSDYDRDSEINRLLGKPILQPHRISPELMEVLTYCQSLNHESDAAFDPTAGTLTRLWREVRKSKSLPTADAMRLAKANAGFDKIEFSPSSQTVILLSSELKLDFGGVAKGFIGDQVIQLLRDEGVPIAYFRAGGDIVVGDSPPNSPGWAVDVGSHPDGKLKTVTLSNAAISISGNQQQFVTIDGTTYSHVVDPRTGLGITSNTVAVVIAKRGMHSDALATTGCLVAPAKFDALIESKKYRGWVYNGPTPKPQ